MTLILSDIIINSVFGYKDRKRKGKLRHITTLDKAPELRNSEDLPIRLLRMVNLEFRNVGAQ